MAKTTEEKQKLDLDEKVTLVNITNWTVGFSRKADGIGDVTIQGNGVTRISRTEVIAQVQNGNTLLNGTDGMGSHATIFIDDAPTRVECGFESEDGKHKQLIFSDEKVKEVFALKQDKAFEEKCKEYFVTRAEKLALVETIKRLNLNDFRKIRFIEKYTGYSVM